MTNTMRGAVAFPLFDGKEGYNEVNDFVLRFTMDDLIQLKNKYRPEDKRVFISLDAQGQLGARTYKPIVWLSLIAADEETVIDCLKIGMKRADGKTRGYHHENIFKDPPFTAVEAAPFVLDALSWAWNGKSKADMEAESLRAARAAVEGGEEAALDDPPTSSSSSTTEPLDADFPPTLSGD